MPTVLYKLSLAPPIKLACCERIVINRDQKKNVEIRKSQMKECRNELNVKINQYRNAQVAQIQFLPAKKMYHAIIYYLFALKLFLSSTEQRWK